MCKPQQRGWADKKTPADLRRAIGHEHEIREWEQSSSGASSVLLGTRSPRLLRGLVTNHLS